MLNRVRKREARIATADEARWFRRLKRCLADMPRNVEVVVGPWGDIRLHERGARDAEFNLRGCADNTPEMDSFPAKRIRGEESSI
jgi:hypothetical protein